MKTLSTIIKEKITSPILSRKCKSSLKKSIQFAKRKGSTLKSSKSTRTIKGDIALASTQSSASFKQGLGKTYYKLNPQDEYLPMNYRNNSKKINQLRKCNSSTEKKFMKNKKNRNTNHKSFNIQSLSTQKSITNVFLLLR